MSSSWVNGHPDEGLLHEWLDAQLSADNASEIEAHVAGCEECGALVAEARGLIAASHRILSALDDVPANVIPFAPQSVGTTDGLVEIATARKAQEARRLAQQRSHTSSRWRGIGKVAALLLIVLVPGVMMLRGDDVAAPIALTQRQSADSNLGAPSPAAEAPASMPATSPAAATAPAFAEPSAKTAAKAMADVLPRAETRGAGTGPATDAAKTSAAGQSGSARERQQDALAEADRAPAAPPTTTLPAASVQAVAPITASAAAAAVQVAQLQSSVAGGRGGVRGGGGGRGATQTLANTPVPPPASSVGGGFAAKASPARTDSVIIARD
ncbi:MAG: zf-HC2 domain-containing protein, partial [Phycisphaerae bacterium]|nr:zf-HC2 domain-containing protein [Gemmatimonadaceae bacterium]